MFEGLLFRIENWDGVALIKNGVLPNQYPRFQKTKTKIFNTRLPRHSHSHHKTPGVFQKLL